MFENLSNTVRRKIVPLRFMVFGGLFIGIGLVAILLLRSLLVSILGAFDVAALVFILSVLPLLDDDPDTMRTTAEANDANRPALLMVSVLISTMVFVAVGMLIAAKHSLNWPWLVLVMITLMLAWCFANIVFALHYAHLFYLQGTAGGDRGGLVVPDTETPDYWDFLYFSFTLGMTFQTSDVSITGAHMRRVVFGHSIAAFVFNMGILAFTINALGNL